ncbi:NAD(P)/FAD-dependent oxidoreductase [Patescibacteria group bacterium]|nr:MAG: NAD(P)/FAD-dependent oxidoreductase [Patescibacteria group bacterium]
MKTKVKKSVVVHGAKDVAPTAKEIVWDVVVIGGGPAGMMAAGRAGERRKRVLLLEKNSKVGKKLLITGGGRCNVTNNKPDVRTMLAKYTKSDKFLFSAFTQFGVTEAFSFFNEKGMAMKEEPEGRMFPVSNKAESVWNVLIEYMKVGRVKVQTKANVSGITFNKFLHRVIITLTDGSTISARSCVVATGGTSHPETGSTGEGFTWLESLGHEVIKNDAALVPIALKDSWIHSVAGVVLKDIKLTTFKNDIKQQVYKGKLLFTHVGISGPTVLNMSREVGELLTSSEGDEYLKEDEAVETSKKNEVTIMLDMFPMFDHGLLREKLQTVLTTESNKKIKNSLSSFLPPLLVAPILELAQVNGETFNHSVRSTERTALVAILKAVPLHVSKLLGKNKAVVSSGGVTLSEVNFKTMQSRLVPQVYLVGDVLNINRPSGGYSLQLCWTTGYIAGNNC